MELVLILLLHVSAVDCIEGAYITLASLSHKNKKNKVYACMYARQDKTICICIRVNICIHIRPVQYSRTKQTEGIEQAYGK